jgi:hypothetical protein
MAKKRLAPDELKAVAEALEIAVTIPPGESIRHRPGPALGAVKDQIEALRVAGYTWPQIKAVIDPVVDGGVSIYQLQYATGARQMVRSASREAA